MWQSPDPIDRFNAQSPTIGLNLYQYGLLNPIRYNDPTGLSEDEGIFAKFARKYEEVKSFISNAVGDAVGDAWADRVRRKQEEQGRRAGDDPQTIEQSATEHAQAQSEPRREAARQITSDAVDVAATVLVTRGAGGLFGTTVRAGATELKISKHAERRMAQRNINVQQLEATLAKEPFPYFHEGVWKTGYYDPATKLFAGSVRGEITTVINNATPQYIRNLMRARP